MKRFYIFFVICLTLSCWFNIANAQDGVDAPVDTVLLLIDTDDIEAAQDRIIPDANLAAAVRQTLGLASNASITMQAMQKLTRLRAISDGIKDLTGLEYATQLTNLNLDRNQISDITPLADLTQLTSLSLDDNQIQNVRSLAGLVNLKYLYLKGNPIQDSSPLASLTKLSEVAINIPGSVVPDAYLAMTVRQMLRLAPFVRITKQHMSKLTTLTADDKDIEDLTGLEHATELTALSLIDNNVVDLRPLAELTKLEELSLADNWIVGTGPLFTLLKRNPNLELDIREDVPTKEHPPIYWLSSFRNNLLRQTSASADVETLWESHSDVGWPQVSNFAVDTAAGKLYWAEEHVSGSELMSANLYGDPNVQILAELNSLILSIAVDPKRQKLYWIDSDRRIQRANLNGENIQTLVKNLERTESKDLIGVSIFPDFVGDGVYYITVDVERGKLYWTEGLHIRRADLNAENVQNVVTVSGSLDPASSAPLMAMVTSIAITDRKIYWSQLEYGPFIFGNYSPRKERVLRADLDGSNVEELGDGIYDSWSSNGGTHPRADLAVDAANETLYYTSYYTLANTGRIWRLDLNSLESEVAILSGGSERIALGSSRPPIGSVHTTGHPPMYWVDAEAGTLHRTIGDEVENLVPSVQNATSLAVDAANEKLYWTEQTGKNTGRVRRADLDGSNVQLVRELTSVPHGIAVDPSKGKLYLTNSRGKVQRMNPDGKHFQSVIGNLEAPQGIAIDAAGGKVYWTEQTGKNAGKVRRADLNGSNVALVKALKGVPQGIALDTSKGKLYLTNSRGKVQRMNPDGKHFQSVIGNLEAPQGIVIDAAGGKVYWTEEGSIRRANLDGSNLQDVATGLGTPAGIVLGIAPVNTQAPAAPTTRIGIPDQTALLANYPNPFNPETWIPYQLAKASDVKITIYDTRGALVRTLILGHQRSGTYTSKDRAAYWDGRNALGERVASGIYFYQLRADNFSSLRRMIILK